MAGKKRNGTNKNTGYEYIINVLNKDVGEYLADRHNRRVVAGISLSCALFAGLLIIFNLILPATALTGDYELSCAYAVHQHDDSCYDQVPVYDKNGELTGTEEGLVCGLADYVVHEHNQDCYDGEGNLVCPLPEIEEHHHTKECYEEEQVLVCGLEESEPDENGEGGHIHDDSCYETREIVTCGQQELHTHDKGCYDESGNLTCGLLELEEHVHGDECFVEKEEPQETDAFAEESQTDYEQSADEQDEIAQIDQEEDLTQSEENDEKTDDQFSEEADQSDISDITADSRNQDEEEVTEGWPAQDFSGTAGRLSVSVTAPQGALPEGTGMELSAVSKKKIINSVNDVIDQDIEDIEAVEIAFRDAEGQEIEPLQPVQVNIRSDKIADSSSPVIVHVDDRGKAEVIDQVDSEDELLSGGADGQLMPSEEQVVFMTDEFSTYAIVYTVDFYYEDLEWHMEGGSEFLLSNLFHVLGIDRNVKDVKNVVFSNPELVKVEKTSDNWKLISLQPFTSEEELTIYFSDSEIIKIRVEDQIIDGTDNLVEGEYIIYTNSSGKNYAIDGNGSVKEKSDTDDSIVWYLDKCDGNTWSLINKKNPDKYISLDQEVISGSGAITLSARTDSNKGWDIKYNNNYLSYNKNDNKWEIKSGSGSRMKLDLIIAYNVDPSNFVIDKAIGMDCQESNAGTISIDGVNKGNYRNPFTLKLKNGMNTEQISAIPTSPAYYFSRWILYKGYNDVDRNITSQTIEPGTTNFSNIVWLRAVFNKADQGYINIGIQGHGSITLDKDNSYDIEALINNGTINGSNPVYTWRQTHIYYYIDGVGKNANPIKATPASGYIFKGWIYDGKALEGYGDTIPAGQLSMDSANHTLTAVFGQSDPFHFSIRANPGSEDNDTSAFTMGHFKGKYYDTEHTERSNIEGYNYDGVTRSDEKHTLNFGFTSVPKAGCAFAFWLRDDGVRINNLTANTEVPKDGTTYTGYFKPKGQYLAVYRTDGNGTVNKEFSYSGDDEGATASEKSSYVFFGWYDESGNLISGNKTFPLGLLDEDVVATARFKKPEQVNIQIESNNVNMGKVYYSMGYGWNSQDVLYLGDQKTDSNGQLVKKIMAKSTDNNKYEFSHWELNHQRLEGFGPTISAGAGTSLHFQNGDLLTAVFKYKNEAEIPKDNYPGKSFNESELNKWFNSLDYNEIVTNRSKTAEVYDYDNRIYEVDITGNSKLTAAAADLNIAFVTDVSNSMLFPSSIVDTGKSITLSQTSCTSNNLDKNKVYLAIADVKGTATQYAIYYNHGNGTGDAAYAYPTGAHTVNDTTYGASENNWVYMDASYYAKYMNGQASANDKQRYAKKLEDAGQFDGTTKLNKNDNGTYELYLPNTGWLDAMSGTSGQIFTNGANRLYYLKEAVMDSIDDARDLAEKNPYDPNTNVKVAYETFAKFVYDKKNFIKITGENADASIQSMKNDLISITTFDGTRQDKALKALITNETEDSTWDKIDTGNDVVKDPDEPLYKSERSRDPEISWADVSGKKYAILITDGAPLISSKQGTDAINALNSSIQAWADELKKKDITLITVGLSMDKVENGAKILYTIGDSGDKFYKVEDASQLKYVLRDILKGIMAEAIVGGRVEDEIDEAFYPVNYDGTPLQPGNYRIENIQNNGKNVVKYVAPGSSFNYLKDPYVTITEADGKYKVTWYNQTFPAESSGDRWRGTIYVKTKEDYLGGNTVNTNYDASITAEKYTANDDSGNSKVVNIKEDKQPHYDLVTPYVNIDELSLTQEQSEWTVYLKETVDPLPQIKKFYEDILVKEVVTGTKDQAHVFMENKNQTLYDVISGNTQDGRTTRNNAVAETFPLSRVIENYTSKADGQGNPAAGGPLSDDEWAALINGDTVRRIYTEYGHTSGIIELKLEKDVVDGEPGLTPQPHEALVPGQGVEKYTLTASYIPYEKSSEEYQTGNYITGEPGKETDTMLSENEHIINVFKRALAIHKVDQEKKIITSAPAVFTLYRKASPAELADETVKKYTGTELNTQGIPADLTKYVAAAEISTKNSEDIITGIATLDPVYPLKDTDQEPPCYQQKTEYYIVETETPAGYTTLPGAIKAVLDITDVKNPIHENTTAYNWTQTARLSLEASDPEMSQYLFLDQDNRADMGSAETKTVQYMIMNQQGVTLPETGGMGTTLFYIIGSILVAGAAILLIARSQLRL